MSALEALRVLHGEQQGRNELMDGKVNNTIMIEGAEWFMDRIIGK